MTSESGDSNLIWNFLIAGNEIKACKNYYPNLYTYVLVARHAYAFFSKRRAWAAIPTQVLCGLETLETVKSFQLGFKKNKDIVFEQFL